MDHRVQQQSELQAGQEIMNENLKQRVTLCFKALTEVWGRKSATTGMRLLEIEKQIDRVWVSKFLQLKVSESAEQS